MTILKALQRISRSLILVPLLVVLSFTAFSAPAQAETEGTGWEAFSDAHPTNLAPGGSGAIELDVVNVGAKPSVGPVTVTDTLPAGLTATNAGGMGTGGGGPEQGPEILPPGEWLCTGNGSGERNIVGATVITCTSEPGSLPSVPIIDESAIIVAAQIGIAVNVELGAAQREPTGCAEPAFCNRITVAGGGAASTARVSNPVTVSSATPGSGFPLWDVWFSNADGTLDTQAGSHPYAATFVNGFNELAENMTRVSGEGPDAGGEPRDLEVVLPAGFFGDPGATPQCTRTQLDGSGCSIQTQIGVDGIWQRQKLTGLAQARAFPVYNMVPPPGVADEFAFSIAGKHVIFDSGPSSADGNRIVAHINNLPEGEGVDLNLLTLWGVPPEPSHSFQRCNLNTSVAECNFPSEVALKPFLTLPTSCQQPGEQVPSFALRGLSTWISESANTERTVETHDNDDTPTGFTGCEKLSILPSFSAVPDTAFADTPAGLTAEVKVPQETLTEPHGLVAATLKNTTVTLPEGLVINPGQAAGLVACQSAEANLEGEGPQHCPAASKVGTVKIQTPLLEGELEPELEGDVYVLQSNPPELKLLVAASADGIDLKLPGTVRLNETTGQVTATFNETPELPFTDFKLTFSGGAQAALATPTQCGAYTTNSDFEPWTTPFAAEVLGSDGFSIGAGPLGAPCPSGPLPFSPSLIAGATNPKGGAFTSFSLLLQRADDQQRIDGLQFKAPPGLSGEIANVPLCLEPQAQAGTCSAASQIGHTTVASGPGPFPLIVPEPGRPEAPIYLTGPYMGAPFGLSIVTPVLAGPFNLGTIVTRAKIEVDPHTAQITVTVGAGGDPLPQLIDGVPTDLRTINSVIERPGGAPFMVNPTHCEPASFSGTAYGAPPPGAGGAGATAAIASSFDMVGCKGLAFAPKFTASTTSKDNFNDNGASLVTKVTNPSVPQGTQSDIARVKVELPIALPSRLTTLQKACVAKVFEADPANCPPDSFIGHATVHTPLLPVPLEGPAIFVSHGGEAFPSVIVVLQGDNVTIDLVGTTFISHAGITSTTFKTLPDAPFSTFELNLPTGKFSALATNTNICKPTKSETVKKQVSVKRHGKSVKVTKKVSEQVATPLVMPTEIIGQNGAEIHENTKIAVTGCRASKSKPKKQAKKGKGQKKRKSKT